MTAVLYAFAKTSVNSQTLTTEILGSSITVMIDHIDFTAPNLLEIYFKAPLTASDVTTLETLVANHTGAASPSIASMPFDSENAPIFRMKTTKPGWHYEPRSINFTTGTNVGFYNHREDGTAYGDATLKFYDAGNNEITQTGLLAILATFLSALTANCVKTVVEWQPNYDMDIIGGILAMRNAPSSHAYAWVTIAPDVPANLGGSIPLFAGGWNLYVMGPNVVHFDGRGVKSITADGITNKFRVTVKHPAGDKLNLQFVFENFRS